MRQRRAIGGVGRGAAIYQPGYGGTYPAEPGGLSELIMNVARVADRFLGGLANLRVADQRSAEQGTPVGDPCYRGWRNYLFFARRVGVSQAAMVERR